MNLEDFVNKKPSHTIKKCIKSSEMTKLALCIAVYQNKEADVIENQNVPG